MKWPEIVELNDVAITPLFPTNDPADLHFWASNPSPAFNHYRFGRPQSVLKVLPLAQEEVPDEAIGKPFIYGGLLFNHFGHTIAESLHRLWPRFAVPALKSAPIVFTPVRTKVTPYLLEALNLYGIGEAQLFRTKKPMRFRRLFVGPQARQMGGPTIVENYRAMLDGSLAERLPPPSPRRRLYVSRLDYHWSGSFYGESALARLLATQGFETFYPERHSLTELVRIFRDTEVAIFAEGSAIHALELCGSRVPDVLMISRRPNSRKRFARLLDNICRRWVISDRLLFNAGLDDFYKKHSGVVDLPAVLRDIADFIGSPAIATCSAAWAAQAVEEDCERLIRTAQDRGEEQQLQRADALRRAVLSGTRLASNGAPSISTAAAG